MFILFGGNNGLTDIKEIVGANVNAGGTQRWLFIASSLLMLRVFILIARLVTVKFGKVQQSIRDSESRVRFSGNSTTFCKMLIFVGDQIEDAVYSIKRKGE